MSSRSLSRTPGVAALSLTLLAACSEVQAPPEEETANTIAATATIALGPANVLDVDLLSQAVVVPVSPGGAVVVEVSGAIYGQDFAPPYNDPLAGVLVVATTNRQDGSAVEARIMPGTHYYISRPQRWRFTMNSASDRIYLVAVNSGVVNLTGQYSVRVNGVTHAVTPANTVDIDTHPAAKMITAPLGGRVRVTVTGAVQGIDLSPALNDPLAGALLIAVTDAQDGSGLAGWVMPGTHYYNRAPQTQDIALNSGTDRFYAIGVNAGVVNLGGRYSLHVQ